MSTYTMSFDSQLIEDYILTAGIPTLTSSDAPLAVVMNAKRDTELLAIHSDGELYHVVREPLSESGWNFFGVGAAMQTVAAVSAAQAWALGNDNRFWIVSSNRWSQVPNRLPGQGDLEDLSVGTDGTVWAFDSSNQLYRYSADGSWNPQSSSMPLKSAPRGRVELTILNCSTLAMALPFTVAYKSVNNNAPPFTGQQVASILGQPFLPPSARAGLKDGDIDWGIVYAVWSGVVALTDALSDYIATALVNADGKSVGVLKSAVKFLGYCNAFALSFQQFMAWHLLPNPDSWDWSAMEQEERWTKGAWIATWAPPILNTAWLSVPILGTLDRAELVGQILLTVTGAVNTGVGITAGAMASDEDAQTLNIAIAIFSNASALLTPLLMDYVVDLTEGDSAGFKGWVDPFCDIAGGVLVASA